LEVFAKNESNYNSEYLKKKIAKGAGISFFGNTFQLGLNFSLNVVLGRFLGAASYGIFAIGYSIVEIMHMFSALGLQHGIVRFIPLFKGEKSVEQVKGTLISALSLSILTSAAAGFTLFFLSDIIAIDFFNEPELVEVLKLFSFLLPFEVITLIALFSIRAYLLDMKYEIGVRSVFLPLTKFLTVSLVFFSDINLLELFVPSFSQQFYLQS
jgi:O-antigen/teichoic acid export membrane protein